MRPVAIFYLLVQYNMFLYVLGPANLINYCSVMLNSVTNKFKALIKFANKLVSLLTGSENELRQSCYSIRRNTYIHAANSRSYIACWLVFMLIALYWDIHTDAVLKALPDMIYKLYTSTVPGKKKSVDHFKVINPRCVLNVGIKPTYNSWNTTYIFND